MNQQTDGLGRIRSDPDAFEEFYREHLDAVQRFVARRVDDPHRAADLTADIFLAAIDSAHRYHPDRGTERGWLYGLARNTLADEVRRRSRHLRATRRVEGRRHLDDDALARMEQRLDAERESRELYRALDRLKPADRALLELVALDGLTVADAARVLDMKPDTARVRLHRSRALVKEHLRPMVAITEEVTT